MAKYYSGTLSKGSSGKDVTEWQNFLKSQGYAITVDGIFGDNTEKITREYQTANGLGADGIVGVNTWSKAGYSNINTPTAAPTLSPTPTNPTYDSTSWDDTDKGKAASGAYEAAKNALNNYGSFTFSENEWLERIKDSIDNYGEFSYDVNSDALYQQYADQYMRQGKIAMQDTMGQAAAMTGGYGNSYAATVGNQAYQSYLQQLNDRVPELYQLALDRHNMGKQDLYNQYGMLLSEYEREYGLYSDEYNKLLESLGIASDDYYRGADMHYTDQANKNDVLGREFTDAMAIWEANNTNAWNQAEWDESIRQATLTHDLNERQVKIAEEELALRKDSLNSEGSSTPKYSADGYGVKDGYTTKIPTSKIELTSTTGTTNFINSLKTREEFYGRDSEDKKTYKTYENYVDKKLEAVAGNYSEGEIAYILSYYGLT